MNTKIIPGKEKYEIQHKRSVLAKVNSQGSGRQKPSPGKINPKVGEDNE